MKKIILLFLIFTLVQNTVFSKQQNIYSEAYMTRLENKVKSNWIIPHGQADKTTVIVFTIDRDGNILNSSISRQSSDKEFDQKALAAVYKSVPFERIPDGIKNNSITINFNFNQNQIEATESSEITSSDDVYKKVSDPTLTEQKPKEIAAVNRTEVAKINSNNEKKSVQSSPNASDDYKAYKKQVETVLACSIPRGFYFKEKYVALKISIDKDGHVDTIEKQSSSGDNSFDSRVIISVKKTVFPPIPDSLNMSDFRFSYLASTSTYNQNYDYLSYNSYYRPYYNPWYHRPYYRHYYGYYSDSWAYPRYSYIEPSSNAVSTVRFATSLVNLASSIMLLNCVRH